MRVRIKREEFSLHFDGPPEVWNDLLRPLMGGPRAPLDDPSPPAPEPLEPQDPDDDDFDDDLGDEEAASSPTAKKPKNVIVQRPPLVTYNRTVADDEPVRSLPPRRDPRPVARPSAPQRDRRDDGPPPRRDPTQRDAPRRDAPERGDDRSRDARPERGPGREAGRDRGADRDARRRAPTSPSSTADVEKTSDPTTLYKNLAETTGRRGEKDTILAAVWFLTRGQGETDAEAVADHLADHGVTDDIKIRPHLLKHVNRSKMLEEGSAPGQVRLSRKGAGYVRSRLVD